MKEPSTRYAVQSASSSTSATGSATDSTALPAEVSRRRCTALAGRGGPQQGDDQYYGVAAEVVKALHSGGGQAAEAKEGGDLLTGGGEVGGIEEHETHRQQGEHIQVL